MQPHDGSGREAGLDLILRIRLEIFEQAIDEVNAIIGAVPAHRGSLDAVDGFLSATGRLKSAEDGLLKHLGYGVTDVDVSMRGDGDKSFLAELKTQIEAARRLVGDLAAERERAYDSLQDVRRWSLLNLGDPTVAMRRAISDYRRRIQAIRRAPTPWSKFRIEMPRRDHDLGSCYLDLVACTGLRDAGADDAAEDSETMHTLLADPLSDSTGRTRRPPPAVTGRFGHTHRPLGYAEWNLWTLPLMGFDVGTDVIADLVRGHELVDPGDRMRVFFADAYAQYVLGPSYLYAAVFLLFDPDPDPEPPTDRSVPTDAERVGMLLDQLPVAAPDELDGHSLVLKTISRSWEEAQTAFGADSTPVAPAERTAVAGFQSVLTRMYPEIGYDTQFVGDATDVGLQLVDFDGTGDAPLPSFRDLLVAMWFARVDRPDSARRIHAGAKLAARRTREWLQSAATRTTQPRRL